MKRKREDEWGILKRDWVEFKIFDKVNTVVLGLEKSFYCFWISPPANTPTLSNLKLKPWRDFCLLFIDIQYIRNM
jgi:hypothetical protein